MPKSGKKRCVGTQRKKKEVGLVKCYGRAGKRFEKERTTQAGEGERARRRKSPS